MLHLSEADHLSFFRITGVVYPSPCQVKHPSKAVHPSFCLRMGAVYPSPYQVRGILLLEGDFSLYTAEEG